MKTCASCMHFFGRACHQALNNVFRVEPSRSACRQYCFLAVQKTEDETLAETTAEKQFDALVARTLKFVEAVHEKAAKGDPDAIAINNELEERCREQKVYDMIDKLVATGAIEIFEMNGKKFIRANNKGENNV